MPIKGTNGEGKQFTIGSESLSNSSASKLVHSFIDNVGNSIAQSFDFVTDFVDTQSGYQEYGVEAPSVVISYRGAGANIQDLKKDPFIVKLNKSKTLKRVKDWTQVKCPVTGKLS